MNFKKIWLLLLLVLPQTSYCLEKNTINVVVSNKPFHSLVYGVMLGIAKPSLIMQGAESPHTYKLKPKDAQTLQKSDLVFWGGKESEPLLARAIHSLAHRATVVALDEVKNLTILPLRGQDTGHEESEEHDSHDSHHHSSIDPHIWLDLHNAQVLVTAIEELLSKMDKANSSIYKNNASTLTKKLQVLDQELSKNLQVVAHVPFLVYHDSYRYLEKRYNLSGMGAITTHLSNGSSAGKIKEVRQLIKQKSIKCIFKEPQFSGKIVKVIADDLNIKQSELDPIGVNFKPDEQLYFSLLGNISNSLVECLAN